MKNRPLTLTAILVIGVAGAAWFFINSAGDGSGGNLVSLQQPAAASPRAGRPVSESPSSKADESTNLPIDSVSAAIESLFSRLRDGQANDAELEALRRKLLAADPEQASAAIRAFLDSGRDARTRQEFSIGEGGTLAGTPTLRTLLLDVLGQISRKLRSDAASVVSRQILESKQSPDEWAVAMRNVAWQDPRSKSYLASKMREMLSHEPWRAQPSAGMLEAFDVIVHSADPTFIPQLTDLLRNGDSSLRRASAVALDRLAAMAPLEVMTFLNTNPRELADRPFLRADYFAKANLSDPGHLQILQTYLARPDVSLPEKQKLIRGLATPATFVSETLITPPAPAEVDDTQRLQQLQSIYSQWQKEGRFPDLHPEMNNVQGRIGR